MILSERHRESWSLVTSFDARNQAFVSLTDHAMNSTAETFERYPNPGILTSKRGSVDVERSDAKQSVP